MIKITPKLNQGHVSDITYYDLLLNEYMQPPAYSGVLRSYNPPLSKCLRIKKKSTT